MSHYIVHGTWLCHEEEIRRTAFRAGDLKTQLDCMLLEVTHDFTQLKDPIKAFFIFTHLVHTPLSCQVQNLCPNYSHSTLSSNDLYLLPYETDGSHENLKHPCFNKMPASFPYDAIEASDWISFTKRTLFALPSPFIHNNSLYHLFFCTTKILEMRP